MKAFIRRSRIQKKSGKFPTKESTLKIKDKDVKRSLQILSKKIKLQTKEKEQLKFFSTLGSSRARNQYKFMANILIRHTKLPDLSDLIIEFASITYSCKHCSCIVPKQQILCYMCNEEEIRKKELLRPRPNLTRYEENGILMKEIAEKWYENRRKQWEACENYSYDAQKYDLDSSDSDLDFPSKKPDYHFWSPPFKKRKLNLNLEKTVIKPIKAIIGGQYNTKPLRHISL